MKPRVRCSSLDQLLECPGSRTLTNELATLRELLGLRDHDESTPVTWAGIWCHWEAARIFIEEHGAVSPHPLPAWPPGVPRDFRPTGFDHWCVHYYVNTVLRYVGPGMALEVENELAYDLGPCWLTGHEDLLAISADGTIGVGSDFKRGYNPVDPAGCNWQMAGYQTCVKLAYPKLESLSYIIVQPAVPDMEGFERVSTTHIEGDDLARLPAYMAAKIGEALAHPMDLNSGWRQCMYCAASLQCPAVAQDLETMKMTLTKLSLTPEVDNEILGAWKVGQKLLTPLMKKASDLLRERVDAAGGTLVTKAGSFATKPYAGPRKVQSEEGWNRLCDLVGDPVPDELVPLLYSCMGLSASEIERLLAEVLDIPHESKPSKKDKEKQYDSKDAFRDKFGDITERSEGTQLVVTS